MPTHPFFGEYDADPEDTSCDFAPITLEGTEVELLVLEIGPEVTPELIDTFADFCRNLEGHVASVRAGIRDGHRDLVIPFVADLVDSNPELDILGELFPDEKKLSSVAEVTADMVERATSVTNCMTSTDPDDQTITIDLTFASPDMNYLFACKFDHTGRFLEIDIES